jgi:hypothetical protein
MPALDLPFLTDRPQRTADRRKPPKTLRGACLAVLATGLCAPLWATPARVQENSSCPQVNVVSLTVPYTAAQVAGHLNYVAVGWIGLHTILSVTDTQGNTYVPATTVVTGPVNYQQVIFYAKNIAGSASNAVTVKFDSPVRNLDVRIAEYSGLSTTNAFDVAHSATGTGTSTSSGSVSTTNANDFLVASNKVDDYTTAAGTGYTNELLTDDGDILEYRNVTSTGSYSATATQGNPNPWIMQLVAFRASGSPAGGDSTAPGAPSGLSATMSPGTPVNLTWTAATDNVGVTAYLVDRCKGSGCSNFTPTAIPSGTTYGDLGVTASTSYTYRVRAIDASGNIGSPVTVTVTTPAITFVQGNYGDPDSASTVSATYLLAQTSGDLNIVAVAWGDATSHITSITDTVGNTYLLAVGPTNNGVDTEALYYAKNIGAAAPSANTVTVNFDAVTPSPDIRVAEYSGLDASAPLDKTASATGNGPTSTIGPVTTTVANEVIVASAYFNSAGTGGAGTGYAQRIFTDPDGDLVEDKVVTSTGSYSASATQGPSDYWLMSLASFKAASGGSGGGAPSAPSNLSASAGATLVNLTWTASTGSVSSYLIERCQGSGCTNFAQVGTSATNSYTDSGLAASTTYQYRVRATDAGGDLSGYSNTATAATTATLNAPTGLVIVAAASSEIDLAWSSASGGSGTISYLLERCSGVSCSNFAQIGSPSGTGYNDTALTGSTAYSYRVRATDSLGDLSGYSAVVSYTTPSAAIADCK